VKCAKVIDDRVNKSVKCVKCEKWTHKECSGLSKAQWAQEEKVCKTGNGTFVCGICDNVDDVRTMLSKLLAASHDHSENFCKVKKDLNELSDSVEFRSSKFDEFKVTIENHSRKIETLEKDNAALRQEVKKLSEDQEDLASHSRINNIEITGLPEERDEKPISLVTNLCENLGVDISLSDIDKLHRVNSFDKRNPRPLIVRFSTNLKKSELMTAIRSKIRENVKITARLFGINNDRLVFINHHLLPKKKFLHKPVRDLRPRIIKSGIYGNGTIWAVLNNATQSTVYIRNPCDLESIRRIPLSSAGSGHDLQGANTSQS